MSLEDKIKLILQEAKKDEDDTSSLEAEEDKDEKTQKTKTTKINLEKMILRTMEKLTLQKIHLL